MNEPKRICYVHVGMHKTGTTSIQRFLALNRERFANASVLLPRAGCDNAPDYVSHHQLAYDLTADSNFEPQYGGIDALADELEESGAVTACISSENLSLLWHHSAGLVRLRDSLVGAGFAPRIVCYIRPQASFCTSVYAQIVCNASYRTPFFEYLNDTLTRGRFAWGTRIGPLFDYDKLINAFAGVFGRDAIIVRRYRSTAPDAELLLEFARLLLPSAQASDFVFPPLRENGSLDFNTVLFFLGSRERVDVPIRFAPLNIGHVLRFGLRFFRANSALADRYAVRLPAFESIDIARASPLRRTLAKTRALAISRRALMACETRIAAGSRWASNAPPPALLEAVIAATAAIVAWASLVYGTRVASTALVEFGMLSIVVALSAFTLLAGETAKSLGATADSSVVTGWAVRLSAVGYASVGVYAVVNAVLDVRFARFDPDWISYPGAVAAAAAVLIVTAIQPLRKRALDETTNGTVPAGLRDDRIYLACCYVALFGQAVHALMPDWWLDTVIDVLVVVLVTFKVYQIRKSSDLNSARVAV